MDLKALKSLSEYLTESLEVNTIEESEEIVEESEEIVEESKETINDEKSFREAAKAKFEEVFGEELDEDKMNETIEGLLEDNKDLVEKGEWGELIGMLNKSFSDNKNDE